MQSTNKYASRGDVRLLRVVPKGTKWTWKQKGFFPFSFFFHHSNRKREQHIVLYTAAKLHVVSCEPNEPMGRLLIKIDQEIIVAMRLPSIKKNVDLEPKTGDEPHDSNFIETKLGLSKKGA